MPAIARLVHRTVFFQDPEKLRHRRRAKGLTSRQRQFERRGLQMRAQNQKVVRIDQSLFRIAAEEIFGMIDQILVERTARRHVDRGSRPSAAAGTADLLPGAGNGSGIAAKNRGVEVADVDAEFESIRADHAADGTVAQPVLDLAPLQWQIATAVTAYRAALAESIRERLLQVAEEDFDLQPSSPEDDGLHPAAQEGLGDPLTLQRRGAPDAQLSIQHRWVVEEEALGPARCAVVVNQRDGAAGQPLGQLLRIGDGGRTADHDRVTVIERADPPQTAEHVR